MNEDEVPGRRLVIVCSKNRHLDHSVHAESRKEVLCPLGRALQKEEGQVGQWLSDFTSGALPGGGTSLLW